MPALPSVPRTIRLDFRQAYGAATRVQDRIFLQYSGALSAADLATILTTVRNAWNTNLAPQSIVGTSLQSVTGTDLNSTSGAQAVNSVTTAGTIVDPQLASDTALVVKFKIARRYRGGHPRFYFVGRGQGSLASSQQWSAGTITAVGGAFASFIAACVLAPPAAVGTLTHVNVSYFLGFTVVTNPISGRARNVPRLRIAGPVVDAVLSYSINPFVASQRRRSGQSP